MPDDDAFSHLSACFRSQDFNIASQNHTKIYQKCIRRRVRAVLTQQIFSSPKAFLAGHIGDMSKRKAAGIGQICMSKPTWFDSRSANLGANLGWSPVTSTQKAPGTNLRTLFFALEQWPHPFLNLMILSKKFAKQGKIGNYLLTRV